MYVNHWRKLERYIGVEALHSGKLHDSQTDLGPQEGLRDARIPVREKEHHIPASAAKYPAPRERTATHPNFGLMRGMAKLESVPFLLSSPKEVELPSSPRTLLPVALAPAERESDSSAREDEAADLIRLELEEALDGAESVKAGSLLDSALDRTEEAEPRTTLGS